MIAANNVTVAYAEALLVATPAACLVDAKKPAKLTGVTHEQMARMEREMSNLPGAIQNRRADLRGQGVLNLVLAKGYLVKLLECEPALAYLRQHHTDLVPEFESIRDVVFLEQ